MKGIKHVIECHCVLPQYRQTNNVIYHKFVVFSIIDNSDTVILKHAQCDNCGVIHRVFDICKSEIIAGRDELKTLGSIDDIKLTLPDDVILVLNSYNVDLATYENVKFILDNKLWGSNIILTRDVIEDETVGKALIFESFDKFKIESFIIEASLQNA